METKYAKAKFLDVFKYSFGGLGSNLAFFLVMSYLTFFIPIYSESVPW